MASGESKERLLASYTGERLSIATMTTLVLGLGNPILTDDGVGIWVVREAQSRLAEAGLSTLAPCAFAEASVGGLRLLELLEGHRRAILVDAIQMPGAAPGHISRLRVGDFGTSLHSGSSHDLTLPGALVFGRLLGMELPEDEAISIVAVEVEDVLTFGEGCTPAVGAAIPKAADLVIEMMRE